MVEQAFNGGGSPLSGIVRRVLFAPSEQKLQRQLQLAWRVRNTADDSRISVADRAIRERRRDRIPRDTQHHVVKHVECFGAEL